MGVGFLYEFCCYCCMFNRFFGRGKCGVRRKSGSKLVFGFGGQGTLEYLLIIAVVIVVALVVVSLMTGFLSPAQGVGQSINKVGNWSNTVALTESSVNPDGNYLVRLANMSGDEFTVTNVAIGSTDANYSEDLFMGNAKNFVIDSSEVCSTGDSVSKDVVVTYVSRNGLTKKEVYPAKVFFMCENYTVSLLANQCETCTVATYIGDAVIGEVKTGSAFYSNTSTLLIGTGTKYLSTGSTTVTAGYYDTNNLATIDTDLTAGNIVSGATIFGVAGSATEKGATQYMVNTSPSFSAGYYDANNLASIDSDLNAKNISSNVSIFGVTGYLGLHSGQTKCTAWNGSTWINATTCSDVNVPANQNAAVDNDRNMFVNGRFIAYTNPYGDGNNFVEDTWNNLLWWKGQSSSTMDWNSAMSYCNNFSAGGYSNWRLATVAEAFSTFDFSGPSASSYVCVQEFSPCFTSYIWTSTSLSWSPTGAYNYYPFSGYILFNNKTNVYYARCVRSEN